MRHPKLSKYSQVLAVLIAALMLPCRAARQPNDYFASVAQQEITTWKRGKFPLKVYLAKPAGSEAGTLAATEYLNALKSAFAEWQKASKEHFSFVFVDDKAKSDIDCRLVDKPSQLRTELGLAETLTYGHGAGGLTHATIMVLITPPSTDRLRSTERSKTISLVALHEVGHSLGINGHSRFPSDVMYFAATPGLTGTTISQRDLATLEHLYAPAAQPVAEELKTLLAEAKKLQQQQIYDQGSQKYFAIAKRFGLFAIGEDGARCLYENAKHLIRTQRYSEALPGLELCSEIARLSPDPAFSTAVLRDLAAVYQRTGNVGAARQTLFLLASTLRHAGHESEARAAESAMHQFSSTAASGRQ